ncbi:MAG: hypothetical protein Q7J30_01300, partial [Candidatus Azambacteria bacterium]|nr:hypothetical protein [Candidatus Azambacteria bacterium]
EENCYKIFCYDKYKEIGSIKGVNRADIIFICVPTPRGTDNSCDTSIVDEAIGYITGEKIVIIKSTIIPGTTDAFQIKYPQHKVLFCPEFLTEKRAYNDFKNPKIKIVGDTPKSKSVALVVYTLLPMATFNSIMPAKAAEMFKYFRNSFLAVKDAFANQIYELCQATQIDYNCIKQCAEADVWIGPEHLDPLRDGYRGFNGKCLPKDTEAFLAWACQKDVSLSILKEAVRYNSRLLELRNIKKDS